MLGGIPGRTTVKIEWKEFLEKSLQRYFRRNPWIILGEIPEEISLQISGTVLKLFQKNPYPCRDFSGIVLEEIPEEIVG